MIRYSDHMAAEHLEVHTADPHTFAKSCATMVAPYCANASVVHSGKCVGTSHTLPTMSAGRYTGGLWVGSYIKTATHQWLEDQRSGPRGPASHAPEWKRGSRWASEGSRDQI